MDRQYKRKWLFSYFPGDHSILLPGWISIPRTLFLVLIAWVLFRAETLPRAAAYLAAMFGSGAASAATPVFTGALHDPVQLTALTAGILIAWAPFWRGGPLFKDDPVTAGAAGVSSRLPWLPWPKNDRHSLIRNSLPASCGITLMHMPSTGFRSPG